MERARRGALSWAEEKKAFQTALHRVSVNALVALSRFLPASSPSQEESSPTSTSSEDDTSDESTASPSVYAGETAAGTAAAESAAADAAAAVSATEASRVQLQHSSRLHQQSPADPSLDDSLRSDANAAKCPAAAPAASDSLSEYCLNGILVVRVLLLITAATTAVHTPRKQAPGCNCNLCRWANQVNSLTAGSIFHPLPIYSSTEGSWLAKQLTTELASQLASELGSMPARR